MITAKAWRRRYEKKLEDGICPRCGKPAAIREIHDANGKLRQSRQMSTCYDCIIYYRSYYKPHDKKRNLRYQDTRKSVFGIKIND